MAETKPNANVPAKRVNTALGSVQDFYLGAVTTSLKDQSLALDAEQKACLLSTVAKMYDLCNEKQIDIKTINQTSIVSILQQVSLLRLNMNAVPRECYMIIRGGGKSKYPPKFEFGIEGDGNDKLVRHYGVGVANLHRPWIIREGDEFTLASFNGLEITPPTWKPKGFSGKPLMVVYPLEYEDGTIEYQTADRDSVAINLAAHIINNTKMSYDIKDDEKLRIKKALEGKTLDEILADQSLMQYASPAWNDPHSREQMVIRKMRNNALKPIPKDFGSAYIADAYEQTFDDYDQYKEQPEKPKVDPEQILEAEVETEANTEKVPDVIPQKSSAKKANNILAKDPTESASLAEPAKPVQEPEDVFPEAPF